MKAMAYEPQHDIGVSRASWSIAGRAHLACVLEASAPKPGNVSPGRPFADMRYEDFLVSAEAIARPLEGAGRRPLGETILQAVERVTDTVAKTLADAGVGAADIATVFLTGGSTATPLARRSILGLVPQARIVEGDMFGSVGLGLAMDAKRKFG